MYTDRLSASCSLHLLVASHLFLLVLLMVDDCQLLVCSLVRLRLLQPGSLQFAREFVVHLRSYDLLECLQELLDFLIGRLGYRLLLVGKFASSLYHYSPPRWVGQQVRGLRIFE